MIESEKTALGNSSLPAWTLVTSHGLALRYVATHPDATVKQTAEALKLTERRVADIIRELASADLIVVKRTGRQSEYINPNASFRHPLVADIPFRGFIRLWRWSSRYGERKKSEGSGRGTDEL